MLDEATASLDISKDKLIQKAIREVFVDATVILIAHRLDNVYGLDRVLMLDGGKASCLFCIVNPLRKISRSLGTQGNVVEFDRPEVLLNKTASELRSLARETGADEIIVESEGVGSESSPEIMDKREMSSESSPEIVNKDMSPESVSIPEMVEKHEIDEEEVEDDSVEILDRPVANQSSVDDDDLEMLNDVPPKT
ncbi:unnamed protein product [Heligmosomoides polygyrus]|uniref:ABC transporter domain-containing protein n=1 Tax=Heligmosomoides polygyrus TaxID=6339 RepID=A0A3P8EGS5_HELPZ|nr:unnamed protein product [Heligmosomoides polygyrus]